MSRLAAVAFALFGWAIAVFAWAFGVLTCETGCFGAGPAWKQDPDAAQWGYYWPLGVAFAVLATGTAFAAGRGRSAQAVAGLIASALLAGLFWWRVDLASPNSAGDLWIWLIAGLLVGLAAVLLGRRDQRTV